MPKLPVPSARISPAGMEGDQQRDLRFHGGPERALCLYSEDRIRALRIEGHPIDAGTTGENVTIAGLDWNLLVPGARLSLGGAEVEITAYATPCKNIQDSFAGRSIARVSQKVNPGWSRVYARVLVDAEVRVGDPVVLL